MQESGLTVFFGEACQTLTDAALKHLKPEGKNYKVTDRDGMYVLVRPSGTLTFQLDYCMNGRRETRHVRQVWPLQLSLARARELCSTPSGQSPRSDHRRSKSSRIRKAAQFERTLAILRPICGPSKPKKIQTETLPSFCATSAYETARELQYRRQTLSSQMHVLCAGTAGRRSLPRRRK
jgi:hypothetical protein